MGLLDAILAMNRIANTALDDALSGENPVNELRSYKHRGVTHIRVNDQSSEYRLRGGKWHKLPPF